MCRDRYPALMPDRSTERGGVFVVQVCSKFINLELYGQICHFDSKKRDWGLHFPLTTSYIRERVRFKKNIRIAKDSKMPNPGCHHLAKPVLRLKYLNYFDFDRPIGGRKYYDFFRKYWNRLQCNQVGISQVNKLWTTHPWVVEVSVSWLAHDMLSQHWNKKSHDLLCSVILWWMERNVWEFNCPCVYTHVVLLWWTVMMKLWGALYQILAIDMCAPYTGCVLSGFVANKQ